MGRIYGNGREGRGALGEGMDTHERERPAIVRHAAHVEREAEEVRHDARVDTTPTAWRNPTNLDAPEPRQGMVQRWVQDGSQPGSNGEKNWMRKLREGWHPRDPATVPEAQRALYASFKLPNGQDAIRISGLVLCEMPRQIAAQRSQAVQDVTGRQRKSVPDSINSLNEKGKERGLGPVHTSEDKEAVYRGRRTETMVN